MILNFPSQPNRQQPTAPPIGVHKVLEVFHYLIPPDDFGDALVIVAPDWCLKDRYASEIAALIEVGGLMVHNDVAEHLSSGPQAYLHGTLELSGRIVFLYVLFTCVVPAGEWRN